MITTKVHLGDYLPLTCSRKGTCCHGNQVFLNPWEIVSLANEKKCSVTEFIENYTDLKGLKLRFDGVKNQIGKAACNLYIDDFGCSVHKSRPLACRLFPIGRQIQENEIQYIYQGTEFPCLNCCSEVLELPKLTVNDYLSGQETDLYEQAQDEYLEVMQNLADIAFSLLLDTKLAESNEPETLIEWRKMSNESIEQILNRIDSEWIKLLMTPSINECVNKPIEFARKHNELLQSKAQEQFGQLESLSELSKASVQIMAITLFLAKGIGADPTALIEFWIETAKSHGARE
ncbi:MAG: YkgJ family cysteine cluster protein [Fluviicola sp.]|jgi:Fe-S-cluster containining protein|nr:YkgJ family cysteine cluster protein [Fluviicola sp.]